MEDGGEAIPQAEGRRGAEGRGACCTTEGTEEGGFETGGEWIFFVTGFVSSVSAVVGSFWDGWRGMRNEFRAPEGRVSREGAKDAEGEGSWVGFAPSGRGVADRTATERRRSGAREEGG